MTETNGFQVTGDAPSAYDQHVKVFMGPLIEALLERVEPTLGESFLDVACGTGFVARAAARRVGRNGRVAAVDVNEAMLEVARAEAPTRAPIIEFRTASADALPFDEATFDVVVSQQGIQFFGDLDAAIGEFARVTRPGGRVAVTAWTPIADSPYFDAQLRAMTEVFGDDAMAGCASAFGLTGERIVDAFTAAGLTDVTSEVVAPEVVLPRIATYAADQVAATPWGPAFADAGGDVRKRIVRRMSDLLLEDTIDGHPHVPFSTWLVTGTR